MFQHIHGSSVHGAASLSAFLRGPVTLAEQLPNHPDKTHNEMDERQKLLMRSAKDPKMKISTQAMDDLVKSRAARQH